MAAGPSGPFRTDFPAHAYDVIVGAPERTSVPVSVMAFADAEACIAWGGAGGAAKKTPVRALHREVPAVFVLDGLAPGAAFEYRVLFRPAGSAEFEAGEPKRVQMPRRAGEGFRFVIQADSHLDVNTDTSVLARSLDDLATEHPDFLIDLGDTFMTDKHQAFQDAYPLYIAQRWWFSRIADRAPLYLLLGNHDGEYGYGALGEDGIAGWSYLRRTTFFPPPVPKRDGLYTGRTTLENGRGGNWFSFHWGDALIVALDPFWPTTVRARGGRASGDGAGSTTDDNWAKTLGREQYDWLARTLSTSDAPWKLVFIHHLVGGFGKDARGGAAAAPFFEWGGANADGSYGFAEHRPGWPKPIHDLLVETGVRAVFHGHDHLFVREERDGIIYRCVPQPGNGHPSVRSAQEYGYGAGLVREGSGHLVVDVSADALTMRYRRSAPRPDAKAHEETLRR